MEEWYFGYLKNAFIPRYLLTLYRVHRVYHISFYSHFVQNKQSFITKKYSLYVVGEVRSAEALDMLQAMNTGHDGSLSTGHGNNPADMLKRLETMVLMGTEIPLMAVRGQIASAIDIMVHLSRFRDGSRKVVSIMEVTGLTDGEIKLEPLYRYEEEAGDGETGGQVRGKLKATGRALGNREKLCHAGIAPV